MLTGVTALCGERFCVCTIALPRFIVRRFPLPDNGKDPFFTGWLFPVNFDPFDLRLTGATVAPTDKFLNGWSCSFKDCLHATIAQVPYPPFDLRFPRPVAGVRPETHPLYATGNKDMSTNKIHKSPVYTIRYASYPAIAEYIALVAATQLNLGKKFVRV